MDEVEESVGLVQADSVSDKEDEPVVTEISNDENGKPKMKQVRHTQRYRKQWEGQDLFKDWLTRVPDDPYSAFCRACRSTIKSHKKDLKDHARSRKHNRNMLSYELTHPTEPSVEPSDFYYDCDPEYHTDEFYPSGGKKRYFKEEPGSKGIRKPKNLNAPVITKYIERCSRWCCQGPDLPPIVEDIHSSFGRYVADELRMMKNDYDRQLCKMKINQVMFNACLGKFDTIENNEARITEINYSLPQMTHEIEIDDQLTSFGRYIANELKGIQNLHARQIVKLKVNNILYEGTAGFTFVENIAAI